MTNISEPAKEQPESGENILARLAEIDRKISTIITVGQASGIVRAVTILAGAVSVGVVVYTGWQIWNDLTDRQEERVMRAWETVARPIPGNIGKGLAINTILASGATIEALNLSCKQMGGIITQGQYGCEIAPVISDISIVGPDPERPVRVNVWNISGAAFVGGEFKNAWINMVDMKGATFWQTRFEGVDLNGNADEASFEDVSIVNSEINITTNASSFRGELSGTTISDYDNGLANAAWYAWAYADNPPRLEKTIEGMSAFESPKIAGLVYCHPQIRRPPSMDFNDWGDACKQMTEDEARKAFPAEWDAAMRPLGSYRNPLKD